MRADSAADVAKIINAHEALGVRSALLVTVPVPEDFEVPAELLFGVLGEALEEADRTGIGGRELTPFLLARMAQRSEGATLRANIALLENNARVAAEVAVAYSEAGSQI